MPRNCERCGRSTIATGMSWFSTDTICMDCVRLERKHPKFKEAQDAVIEHERAGDMNWSGIGVPVDLLYQSKVAAGGES